MNALTIRRAALWILVGAKIVGGWGLQWDIQWHVAIGRDSFWIAPHVMMYAAVAVGFVVGFSVLFVETFAAGVALAPRTTFLGLSGSPGFHLATWGVAVVVLAAPVDDLWHRLFGLDVTLWSPPHLLGLFGSVLNTLGCVVIAREVYEPQTRAGLAALMLSGALLYGGIRIVLDPAYLLAYTHGGVRFHAYAILAALCLPLALLPVVRLSRRRWAPLGVLAVAILTGLAGEVVAQVGFAIVQPVSVIGEEIRKDPTSPIATANAIAEKNRGARPPWARLIGLVPAAIMVAADPRLRPVVSTLAYAGALFAVTGWYLAGRPAYQPMVAGPAETTVALVVVVGFALVGAFAGRWLANALDPEPVAPPAAAVAPTAS